MSDHMTAKVLRRAAEIVDQGWCQVSFHRGDKHCLVGALLRAGQEIHGTYDNVHIHPAVEYVALAIGHRTPMCWNDERGRTADEVADALRRAADHADSGESLGARSATDSGSPEAGGEERR